MVVVSVPVETRAQTRPSRLFRSIPHFLSRQMVTLIRAYVMYRSLRLFSAIGAIFVLVGALPALRFTFFYLQGDGDGRLQSLILGGVLILAGVLSFVVALLADAIAMNRRLLEANLTATRRMMLSAQALAPGDAAPVEPADSAPHTGASDAEGIAATRLAGHG